MNISDAYWGGKKVIDVDIAEGEAGVWSLELESNADEDCTVVARIIGNAGGVDNAYYNSMQVLSAPTAVYDRAENGEYANIIVSLSRGGNNYAGIKQEVEVHDPEGESYTAQLRDDGEDGDFAANDGFYTGKIKIGLTGSYLLRSRAVNDKTLKPILLSRRDREEGTVRESSQLPETDEFIDTISELELKVIESARAENSGSASSGGCDSGAIILGGIVILLVALMTRFLKSVREKGVSR
jgi:hypothetical protein